MKKMYLLLSAIAALLFFDVSAQENIIRVSPLAFAKFKAKVHYERVLSPQFTAGAIGSGFFGIYPGARIEPFARFYVSGEAPSGFYFQGKGHYSMNSISVTATDNNGNQSTYEHSFDEWGGSGCFGWQLLAGKKDNIVLDFFTGYRYSSLRSLDNLDQTILSSNELANLTSELGYRVLHSNSFDLGFSLGYRF